jgi:type VI secretion system protein ImpC
MAEEQAATQTAAAGAQTTETSLLDQIVDQGLRPREPAARDRGKDLIRQFVEQFLDGHVTIGRDVEVMINKRITQIDDMVSTQLNEILHNPDFQKLESSWRGLYHLVSQTRTSAMMKIRMLHCSKRELYRDFERAPEFDQNALFKKIYEEEYGVFGGAPFGALIGDYEFEKGQEDIELLGHIANVAAAAHAPFFSAAHPSLLNLDDWTKINNPRDLGLVHESREFAAWKSFRQKEDSRYVGLCLPRTLGRLPYGKKSRRVDEFDYEEKVDGKVHNNYLWMNAAYSLGICATRSFTRYGMAVAMRAWEAAAM